MPTDRTKPYHARFSLRTILLLVSLFALTLPLGGWWFFRLYEKELVHQTEQELISQAAALAATYKHQLRRVVPDAGNYGIPLPNANTHPIIDGRFRPVPTQIELGKTWLLPPLPNAIETESAGDPFAAVIGQQFTPVLAETQRTTLSGIVVLDYKGIVVAGHHSTGLSFTAAREVQLALQGRYASAIRKHSDHERRHPALTLLSRSIDIRVFSAYPVVENNHLWGIIYLSRTPPNVLAKLYEARIQLAVVAICLALAALFVIWFIYYTVIRPVDRLVAKTHSANDGDALAITPVRRPGTKEIEALSRSFSKMAYALHARTEYIREFATHISHEFKTPLHGIRQSTEQLRESSGDTTKQHRNQLLNAITKDNDRLDRLISRLLELARADNITPSGESCYLMPIVKRLAEQFSNNQFHVQIEGEEHYDAPLPADSFDSVITILLENARQHGAKTVHINMHIEEQEMTLRIINDGDAISPDDAEKIFLPFFSTQREKGGIGLGLGIARSLLEAYGGTLQYQPDAEHTTFMLTVPILP